MKILAFSDVHLDSVNDPTSRQEVLLTSTGTWIAKKIEEIEPDLVINNGDTNHRDGGMSTGTISLFKRFFDPIIAACARVKAEFHTVVGNHDQYNRNGSLHVMEQLKWVSVVHDHPSMWTNDDNVALGDLTILFSPYRRELEQYYEELNPLLSKYGDPDLVFTHMDIVDMKMNSGLKSSHGLTADPFHGVEVFNGHYHMPQKSGNVTIIGAPQYTQFRDIDPHGTPKRGAILIEKEKGKPSKITRFANPHTKHFAKFVGASAEELYNAYLLWKDMYIDDSYKVDDEDLNVWFVGPKSEVSSVQNRHDWSGFGVARFTPNDRVIEEETTITIDLSPEVAVDQYVKDFKCSCGEDHDVSVGKEILRQAGDYSSEQKARKTVLFQDINIEDFMSLGLVDMPLSEQGMTLIEGINKDDHSVESNGSGKSAIVEALLWCLFDRTARGIGKDEVIRRGSKKATVEVTFAIDNVLHTVRRERSKGKPVCRVFKGSEDITPHDQRNVNALVESILGVTFEQFLLMVVFAQGFETKFSSFSDSARKEILESFLGIEVYDQARTLVASAIKTTQKQKADFEMAAVKAQQAIDTATQNRAYTVTALAMSVEEDKEERNKVEGEISTLASFIAKCELTYERQKLVVEEASTALSLRTKALNDENTRRTKGEGMIGHLVSQINDLRAQVDALGQLCPTCGQELPQESKQSMHDSAVSKIASLEADLRLYEETMAEVRENVTTLESGVSEAHVWYSEELQKKQDMHEQLADFKAQLRALESKHSSMTSKVDSYRELLRKLDLQIEISTAELRIANESKITVDRTLHSYDYWLSAFDPTGIRSVILRTVVNYVNEYLHEMCGVVTGGSYLVQLSSTKELKSKKEAVNKLDIVVTPDGSYKSGSGGERRKIDLLLNLAVSRLAKQTCGFSPNILFADEVLDNLDLTASQHVLQMFEAEVKRGTSVFLVSHNPSVKPLIPNVVTVVKKNGKSEVIRG